MKTMMVCFVYAWMFFASACAMEKLNSKYLVSYGKASAPMAVEIYFSCMCPYCIELYKRDFQKIKTHYIDKEHIAYTFHPVPKDLLTVCAMECLAKLNEGQKQAFLECMLEEMDISNIDFSISLMQKAMGVLGVPLPNLGKREFLENSSAFNDAFLFLSQEKTISVVPTAEINGSYSSEIPDFEFISNAVHRPCSPSRTCNSLSISGRQPDSPLEWRSTTCETFLSKVNKAVHHFIKE